VADGAEGDAEGERQRGRIGHGARLMPIALEVQSGSRAGERPMYDKSVIAIGRHPGSDLQFDPNVDLLVSAHHAEIREVGGRCTIRDVGSRNGTFVNGQRISAETELADGDEVMFGAGGPRAVVRRVASVARSAATDAAPAALAGNASAAAVAPAPPAPRSPLDATMPPAGAGAAAAGSVGGSPSASGAGAGSGAGSGRVRPTGAPTTDERVRIAVKRHTRVLRGTMAALLVVLVAGVGGAYWLGIGKSADGRTPPRQALLDTATARERLESMDIRAISARNDAGVAFVATELDGKPYGSTAFGVTPSGLLVTNRHNVRADDGSAPTRMVVQFANTDVLLPAHVVTTSGDDSVDLALIQIDRPGRYPVVSGVAASTASLEVGTPVVTIGYPHSLDTPMEGNVVKTSLSGGIVSKHLERVLQIDAYASHGSSGSPVFDERGYVVGVIYGGERDSGGRIVYAVPSERIVRMLPPDARGILKE
jgi:putative serine protease PepD